MSLPHTRCTTLYSHKVIKRILHLVLLPGEQPRVDPALRQQLCVMPALDDAPAVHDQDLVRVDHRGQAVRDALPTSSQVLMYLTLLDLPGLIK